jgi:hypothetical protein
MPTGREPMGPFGGQKRFGESCIFILFASAI